MLASKFHLNTCKEAPADAEVVSHQLMMRAGMIRKHAGGIYTYMPLALKVLRKIEAIVREEMNAAGALEILMPVVQPAELWKQTERWDAYGAELLRIKDRHQRDFVLQPTSEEVVTDIVANEVQSWRQLPLNFYHIQTKFRDERRPRFGLMRGREFTMKDAYSFDISEEAAQQSYDNMFQAYQRIFSRLGLNFRAVNADTGSIGGSRSHEFQVIADTGEDLIVYNPDSQYAANIELAEAPCLIAERATPTQPLLRVPTPGATQCQAVAQQLNIPLSQTVKAVVYRRLTSQADDALVVVLVRGDHEVNDIKLNKLPLVAGGLELASEADITATFGTPPGYLGPVQPLRPIIVIADRTVAHMSDFVCGGNQVDTHYTGVNWGRDLPEPTLVADVRNVVAGDPATDGPGTLAIEHGIEVGHVFFLGDKYSEKLKATFLNEQGKPEVIQMGCYGIGISRVMAAAIEQNHDAKGIIWPMPLAPFEVVICPISKDPEGSTMATARELYQTLTAQGLDVILDDRNLRPGAMFADWELIGVPLRITLGDRSLQEGLVEIQHRCDSVAHKVPLDQAVQHLLERYAQHRL